MIAGSFEEFVDKVSAAIRTTMNTPLGQELTGHLLQAKLDATDHKLTKEEWAAEKSRFMTYLFCCFVKDTPGAMQEMAGHVWEELRKEGK